MSTGHRPRTDAAAIDALINRPQGVTCIEAAEACPATGTRAMLKRLQHLVNYKKAWNCKVPGSLAHRFFGSQAAMAAWQAQHPAEPTRSELARQRRLARHIRQVDKLMALVIEQGASGTLPSELSALLGKPSGFFGGWITDMRERGRLDFVYHRGVRIVHPIGVPLTAKALLHRQRQIDTEFVTRNRRGKRHKQGQAASVHPSKPGLPAGVYIPTKASWHNVPASNDGEVTPTICPAPKFDHRYQVDPLTRVMGGFATQRPGQYDMPASNAVAQVLARAGQRRGA